MDTRGLGPTTDVVVNLSAAVTLPLHLKALASLEDAALEEDIMKEAVRLAIAEQLGGFEKMNITVSHKHGKPSCTATLDFADLCSSIANMQHLYEHIMSKLLLMREMIHSGAAEEKMTSGSDERGCAALLVSIEEVLREALKGPGEAPLAAAIRESARLHPVTSAAAADDDGLGSRGEKDGDYMARSYEESFYDPITEGYQQLLDHNSSEEKDVDKSESED